jgi:hypothetical protein
VLGRSSATRLNIFGGEFGANPQQLRMKEIAEKALAAGKDPDEVWKYTGWKPGMEGKMRFEIDDRAMKFTPEAQASFTEQKGMQGLFKAGDNLREGVPLPKAIDHPDLFKQYPELEGVTLKADHPKSGGASFDENTMTIHVPKEAVMLWQQNSYLDSITHEIQHWVQKKEGFARGGSIEGMAYDELTQLGKRVEFLKSKQNSIKPEYDAARSEFIRLYKNEGMEVANAWFDKQPVVNESMKYQREIESLTSKSHNIQPNYFEGESKYINLAGEIEARDAAARRTWDTDMRRAVPPDMRKDAIIRMGNSDLDAFAADVLKELNY